MNVLVEMTALTLGRPTAETNDIERAAWYEAVANLHWYLAGQGGPDAARENALAARAHERSLELLRHRN
ncbi:hypothetical protein NDR87_23045 [Nocardia sp. CDC159]|uniref:Uncharacterized protein n=1 Tax=Nocardia pulmonis TaxID=2951408 RepID=A0A9X2EAB5_9NOCA|nr:MULTISPECIES: hypothetical protein [Nocardia]MCM6776601.1 hypothetical protein [Nocardia pulmonis]MCM6789250.1 hypothetical protein [Nocardia sp. CDC159]